MTDHYTPWGKRHTGGPRGWAALMTGVATWLGWTLVIVAAGADPAAAVWWSAVAGFFSATVIAPLAYGGLKHCYDAPPAQTGDNVTVTERTRERPKTVRRPSDFEHRYEQTRGGSNPAWRERATPALPDGITAHELREWLFDARAGNATFAARDSRKGEGGRSRGIEDDVTSNVKNWLEQWGVIDIDGSGHWTWGEMAQPLFDALLDGRGFGVLMDDDLPPTESEV